VVFGPPGTAYREALVAFQKSYPDIQVEYTGGGGSQFPARVLSERRADQYLWDVFVGGSSAGYTQLIPNGALAPVRPALIRPDGWADDEQKYIYLFAAVSLPTVMVNWQEIREGELTSLDQVVSDPRFRGKIAMDDPRGPGAGSRVLGTILHAKGEEAVRSLLVDQQVTYTREGRQLVEWLIRGRYPIALASSPEQYQTMREQGVNLDHVKPLRGTEPGLWGVNSGFGALMLMSNAPHPNAAKVFANWLLSPEGQASYGEESSYNSRRNDVPIYTPEYAIDPSGDPVNLARQKDNHWRERAQALATEYIK
jgi:iron(III) transport system substrate-binding protein